MEHIKCCYLGGRDEREHMWFHAIQGLSLWCCGVCRSSDTSIERPLPHSFHEGKQKNIGRLKKVFQHLKVVMVLFGLSIYESKRCLAGWGQKVFHRVKVVLNGGCDVRGMVRYPTIWEVYNALCDYLLNKDLCSYIHVFSTMQIM